MTALKIKHNPFAKAFLDSKERTAGSSGSHDPDAVHPHMVHQYSQCQSFDYFLIMKVSMILLLIFVITNDFIVIFYYSFQRVTIITRIITTIIIIIIFEGKGNIFQ